MNEPELTKRIQVYWPTASKRRTNFAIYNTLLGYGKENVQDEYEQFNSVILYAYQQLKNGVAKWL